MWPMIKVVRRVMLQSLSDIVRVRRLNLVGHILCLREERPASVARNWKPVSGNENEEDDRRLGGPLSRKIYKQCQ